jgi:CRISPR-associated endonuclease/helicase Cas3
VYYAHTLPNTSSEKWQSLEEHLYNVAELSSEFAEDFGAGEWGYRAGLWHDLGKYSKAFQLYLRDNDDYHEAELHIDGRKRRYRGKIDHTSAGAQHAVSVLGVLGHLLAYPIAGHHAGLLDAISDQACIDKRLKKEVEPWQKAPEDLLSVNSLGHFHFRGVGGIL